MTSNSPLDSLIGRSFKKGSKSWRGCLGIQWLPENETQAVDAALGPELSACVSYFLPDQFCSHLEQLAKADSGSEDLALPSEKVNRGYKVKRSAPKLTPEELKAKEDAAFKIIKEGMKRKPK